MHPIERLRYVARAGDADPAVLAEEAALALGALGDEPRALVPATRRLLEFHPGCAPLWWVCAELLSADDPRRRADELAAELSEDPTADELAAALPGGATIATTGGPLIAGALPERPDLAVQLLASASELRYHLRRLGESVEVTGFVEDEVTDALLDATAVLVEAEAVGPQGALLTPLAASLVAAAGGVEVWVVAGRGRLLPAALLSALSERAGHARSVPSRYHPLDEDFAEDETARQPQLVAIEEIAVLVGADGPERPAAALARLRCPVPAELLAVTGR